ncbi:MAG: cyclic nucleotide-binding domain-containing protein [Anaerolineales bacterium]|nr:cyclic nucleotide-binding domain-containing protein [Anaerolineales bacterium]
MSTNGPDLSRTPLSADHPRVVELNFLAGIPHEDWAPIITGAIWSHQLGPFQMLYQQDTPITAIYILLEGHISQYREERGDDGRRLRRFARTIGPSRLLGHLEFLFDDAYRTNARSDDLCWLISIDIHAFSRLIYHFPKIRDKLFSQKIADRLCTFPFMARMAVSIPLRPIIAGFLADETVGIEYEPEQSIYRLGDLVDKVFLVHHGQVKLELAGQPSHLIGNGGMFGAAAGASGFIGLGSGDRRMAHSVTAQTRTEVYAIPYHSFVSITGLEPDKVVYAEIDVRENAIQRLSIFNQLNIETRHIIAGFVSHLCFPNTHLLVQQGEEADSLWVLLEGRAAIRALDKEGNQLNSALAVGPTYFAELALLGQVSQESTVEAQPGSEWLRFHWRDLEAVSAQLGRALRPELNIRTTRTISPMDEGVKQKYDWLQPGEQVIIFSRRHWVAFLRKMLPGLILFAFLFAFFGIASLIPGPQQIMRAVILFLMLPTGGAIVWGTIDYLNDWLVVTNRRVMHQEKVLFINEWRKEAPLEQVQNVDFRSTWLGKILDYGTMTIATAATAGTITFDYTTHFRDLRETIIEQRKQRQRHTTAQSKLVIQRMLEARLGVAVDTPSRVYRGGVLAPPPTGWRRRVAESMNARLRREQGNRIIWRKHWLVLIPRLWFSLLVLSVFLILSILPSLTEIYGAPQESFPLLNVLTVVGVLLTLIALVRVIWVIADWRNDTYEVSNVEIAHVDRVPLGLSEDRMSAGLGRIQNVSMSVPTPLHWLFNYGNVVCQTAAETGAFIFYAVPDPRAVAQEILKRMDDYRKQEERESARKRSQELPDWFEMYNRIEPEVSEERQRTG